MRTKRIYVSYDVRDPQEARMQEVLNGFGRRRAEILNAVITHLANIYGWDVFQWINLDGLLYLLRTDEERILHGICPLYREIGMRATGGMERQTVISPETRSQSKAETAAETVTTPTHPTETVTAMPIETHKTIENAALKSAVQPPNAQGSMDSDEMRKNFVSFLQNGFYEQED